MSQEDFLEEVRHKLGFPGKRKGVSVCVCLCVCEGEKPGYKELSIVPSVCLIFLYLVYQSPKVLEICNFLFVLLFEKMMPQDMI